MQLRPDLAFRHSEPAAPEPPKQQGFHLLGVSSFDLFPASWSEVTNLSLISWFFLICFPRWSFLKPAVFLGPIINAVIYCVVILYTVRNPDAPQGSIQSLEGIAAFFSNSDAAAVFAGWLHYCVFDPLVGLGEVLDSQKLKVPHLLVVPCLLMTMLAGPVGFLMYLSVRQGVFGVHG
ncbi:unnamed protein product [Effrenium voratum]|uniref:DUF4281 domain-containing protein n=1 Tax=Effrenium voratum TaxID=2562239 RepID=A0AA36J9I6_9DINO|nr:unnamed protein product [Effrenium voratum]